jgi:signal transduction histidine kinase
MKSETVRLRAPFRALVDPLTWRAVPYLLVTMGLGLFWFLTVAAAGSVAVVMTLIWVGFPMLAMLMLLWRGGAMAERRMLRGLFGVDIKDPYRPRPQNARVMGRIQWFVKDPATWRDLCYLLLLMPLGLVESLLMLVLVAVTVIFLAAPVMGAFGEHVTVFGQLVDIPLEYTLCLLAGLAMAVVTANVARALIRVHLKVATVLLKGDEAERLRVNRARGIDAAEAERRRIERDLHDGAQLSLLTVAMDLGRAQTKLDSDPEQARDLLAQAYHGTRAAITELRDLARGIHPAILTDRGLDAALSALAAKSPISVDVSVELDQRPPTAVESIAYYIVSESLANMGKHSAATEASVQVRSRGELVIVDVFDNGVGGAVAAPGGGLTGLADRAALIDGVLVVNSPVGGPTLIRAELPCEW